MKSEIRYLVQCKSVYPSDTLDGWKTSPTDIYMTLEDAKRNARLLSNVNPNVRVVKREIFETIMEEIIQKYI